MSRWPDFFIIGAARSGTTSLYQYLSGHPDVFMSSIKEPHFFNEIRFRYSPASHGSRGLTQVRNEAQYLKLFQAAKPHQVLGEATATYLSDKGAALRIKQVNPQAKIIILLREPVDRAYSAFLFARRSGTEGNPSFYEALQEDYSHVQEFGVTGGFYIWPGLYYEQVKCYLDKFGTAQVRIFLYEELAADSFSVVKDVCFFLGVPFTEGLFFDPTKKYHFYGVPRNFLLRWVRQSRVIRWLVKVAIANSPVLYRWVIPLRDLLVSPESSKPPLEPMAREFLRGIYHDDILKLQELIGRDLNGWLR